MILVAAALVLAASVALGKVLWRWLAHGEPVGLHMSLLVACAVGLALRWATRALAYPVVASLPLPRWVTRLASTLSVGRLVTAPLLAVLLVLTSVGSAFASDTVVAGDPSSLVGRAVLWVFGFCSLLTMCALGRHVLLWGPCLLFGGCAAGFYASITLHVTTSLLCVGGLWASDPSIDCRRSSVSRGLRLRPMWLRLAYQAYLRDHGAGTLLRIVLAGLVSLSLHVYLTRRGMPHTALLVSCLCISAWFLAGLVHAMSDWRRQRAGLFAALPISERRWFLIDVSVPAILWFCNAVPLCWWSVDAGLGWWRLLWLVPLSALFLTLQVQLVRRFPVEAGVLGLCLLPLCVRLLAYL